MTLQLTNIKLFTGRLVIETLQNVDADRKCFRMVGGVLVERTVKEVLPALTSNRDQVILMFSLHIFVLFLFFLFLLLHNFLFS